MKLEKKFFLDREDGVEIAKECIKNSDDTVILNIPKDSLLGNNSKYFKELKKLAEDEGKDLLIESIDNHILELASLVGIRAINPVFHTKERTISDIYPIAKEKNGIAHSKTRKKENEIPEYISFQEEKRPDVSIIFEHKARLEEQKTKKGSNIFDRKIFSEKEKKLKKEGNAKRRGIWASIITLIFIGCGWILFSVLPKANIVLVLKKQTVTFNEIANISAKATTVDIATKDVTTIPGELFSTKKNMFIPIDTDKKETVSYKAKGTLIISNAYSSAPQTLVATTRFEAPNGIIFRLDEKTTIPGAKISGNTVIPSSVEVNVTADVAGNASNLPPTKGWKIPGFKGTDRYDKFLVENTKAMSGGYTGEIPVVSDEQKTKTLEAAKKSLSDLLTTDILLLMSDAFKLLPEAQSFALTKSEYQKTKDDSNKFGMFVEGEMQRLVFKEETLKDALSKKYGLSLIEEGYTKIQKFDLTYGTAKPDFVTKTMKVPISGSITYVHEIDSNTLKKHFKGKNESALRQEIFSLPGIENAMITLWPFWVKTVPSKENRISIEVR